MRNGKIATMPERVREELNGRMEKGESSKTILAWMNEEPNPGQKPIPGFDRVPISKQNLSQWRRGGFREWQIRRRIEAADSGMKDLGRTVEMAPLAENLLLKVMGHYALVVHPWDGKANAGFEAEVRILRGLLHDATLMQRAVTQADKLKEAIRQRKREREDLWGGGGLVEAMREMLRKKREERVEAELQRREDAKEEKDSAEGVVKEEANCSSGTLSQATGTVTLPGTGAGESEVVTPGQSESHLEAGVDAEAQRREDAKKEKDSAEGVVKEEVVSESGVVTVGQSESHLEAGVDAKTQRREDAKKEKDSAEGLVKEEVVSESGVATVGQSESHLEAGVDAEAQRRETT